MAAAHSTFAAGGPQLGEFEAGLVATWTSAPAAVAIGGNGTVLAAVAVARRLPALVRFRWQAHGPIDAPGAAKTETGGAKCIDERGMRSI